MNRPSSMSTLRAVAEPLPRAEEAAHVAVEQNKTIRAGVGVRAWDRQRAFAGYTLFAPHNGQGEMYLIDMAGEIAHSWQMPYPPGLFGRFTERGTMFYLGKTPDNTNSYLSGLPYEGGAALEMTWDGRVLWEVHHPDHHHDGILLDNGNVLLICMVELPRDYAAKVRGGIPGTEADGKIYTDRLVEMTTAGEEVWEWCSWDHLDPETDPIATLHEPRDEWGRINGIAEMANGDLVASFRELSMVAILDRRSGEIKWRLGSPPLNAQHAPVPLPGGNLLIFDNGPHRLDYPVPYSRVIEVDVNRKEIVWSYEERHRFNFFSPRMSNAQRLPGGNTLICEGDMGRLFEVTRDGELVWEYVNPFFPEGPDGPSNRVFRAYRYSEEEIARARATGIAR